MALVQCNASFSYQTAGGPVTIAVGQLLDDSDPAVVARRSFFVPSSSEASQDVTAIATDPAFLAALMVDGGAW